MSTRVAFQGEKGAYSEAATIELLGHSVVPIGFATFEECYLAVQSGEVAYAMLPIENSKGGSIHANFDLQLRYGLAIVAELEFRVRHSLMCRDGLDLDDIETVISHPQALAQCDDFLRQRRMRASPFYDTAGSAKALSEDADAFPKTACICSSHAAAIYGLKVLQENIEDDPQNCTRFLLFSNSAVNVRSVLVEPTIAPVKVSMVFSLKNAPGALQAALQSFSTRNVDLTKLESRPDVLKLLEVLDLGPMMSSFGDAEIESVRASAYVAKRVASSGRSNFNVTFFVDCIYNSSFIDALVELCPITPFFKILGVYPTHGHLVDYLTKFKSNVSDTPNTTRLTIGVVGFGNFGQFLAKEFVRQGHVVRACSRRDYSSEAAKLGVNTFTDAPSAAFFDGLDVCVISTSILSFEAVLSSLCGSLNNATPLFVDVLSVKSHAKQTFEKYLPVGVDFVCTHPMFGPESGKHSWENLPMVFDKVRVSSEARAADAFLDIFRVAGCRMVEMTCEVHDQQAASTQFVTHFTGRVLAHMSMNATSIDTKGYSSLLRLRDNTVKDSDDLFKALYVHNVNASKEVATFLNAAQTVSSFLMRQASSCDVQADRLNSISASKTVATHMLAQSRLEAGMDVITTLTVGEPDFNPPGVVLDAIKDALYDNPKGNKYTSVNGLLALRKAIARDQLSRKGASFDADSEILVTAGGKQAIYTAFQAMLNPGDEVIIPTPYWVSYPEIVKLAGATPVFVARSASSGFALDINAVEACITPHTRVLILCNPCNPTGALQSKKTLQALAGMLAKYPRIFVLADEIYERLIWDDCVHTSYASLCKERTILVNGFAKGFAMTGHRLGYLAGPAWLIKACTKLQGQLSSCPSSLAQYGGIAALDGTPETYFNTNYAVLLEKRDLALKLLRNLLGDTVTVEKPNGAFYLFPDVSAYLKNGATSTDLCTHLINQPKGVALVPGDAFGYPHGVRLSYACSKEDVAEAIARLAAGLKSFAT